MICLTHAYMMAHTLNRVLLLPPILPHQPNEGGASPFFVISKRTHEFPKLHRLKDSSSKAKKLLYPFGVYLKTLDPSLYLPLGQVLDLNLTLPGIETMDVREFYHRVYKYQTSEMTQATIEIDYGYSNMNTIRIQNDTKFEATTMKNVNRTIYGKTHTLNITYRDITKTLVRTPSVSPLSSSSQVMSNVEADDPDILVYLDTFKSMFHDSLYRTIPKSKPIMTPTIRQTVRDAVLVSDNDEHMDNNASRFNSSWPRFYAAVHIQGGDSIFESAVDETIRHVFKGITDVIVRWLEGNSQLLPKVESMSIIGLYVATDIRYIRQNLVFNIEALKLGSLLTKEHDVHLMLLYPEDSMGTGLGGKETNPKSRPTATSMLGGLLYADLFWDIQVCACAPIGFFGTNSSSLSGLMKGHRSSRC